jgi:hypothetical protein
MTAKRSIWIGYDSREPEAYQVLSYALLKQAKKPVVIHNIVLEDVVQRGLYDRPTKRDADGKLIDLISRTDDYNGAMATEFAISRFLTPLLAREGLALFMDCDMLPRCDINEVFDLIEHRQAQGVDKALWCVQHDYKPKSGLKMDGQLQTYYGRKNWSSLMVFVCGHPANRALTLPLINNRPGRDLHAFCWLTDAMIGALPATYNHLVGDVEHDPSAKIPHFTNGGPWMKGYEDVPFAEEWRHQLNAVNGNRKRA